MYPQRAGVPGNVSPGAEGMPSSRVTIAEMLKSAGYATAHVGKWHLGHHAETVPNAQGFDHSFGHLGGCIDNYTHFFYWDGPNRHDLHRNGREVFYEGRFFGDLMTAGDRPVRHRPPPRPCFCYWAINMPHYPYQGRAAWLERYPDLPYPRNLYAAFMSTLDERVGTLLARLRALGLDRDTIVIFQADNGHSVEVRAHSGGGSAGPYRGAKFSLFEGGIRVPAIVSWPGRLPNGAVRGQFCTACDWLPTIAEWTGSTRPAATLDGHSLADIARGDDVGSHHAAFHWRSGGTAARPQWACPRRRLEADRESGRHVEEGAAHGGRRPVLSNPPADPSEMTNLAAQHPDIVARLSRLHEESGGGDGPLALTTLLLQRLVQRAAGGARSGCPSSRCVRSPCIAGSRRGAGGCAAARGRRPRRESRRSSCRCRPCSGRKGGPSARGRTADDLGELLRRVGRSNPVAVGDDPPLEQSLIARQQDALRRGRDVRQLRVLQVPAVERVEAREPQEGGQSSKVNVEHEPRLAQGLGS